MRQLLVCLCLVAACEGPAGPQGPAGPGGSDGADGSQGPAGSDGDTGPQGSDGTSAWVVGPGVRVHITGLTYDASGAHVAFKLTDLAGNPLDRTGHLTAGAVDVRFGLAQLATLSDGSPGQYTSYTTVQATSPITNVTTTQAQVESNGTFAVVDVTQGTYTYTYHAALTGMDPTLTQTALAVATRTFNSAQAIDRDTFSMRPDSGTVAARQEVTDQTCNACHGSLGLHGGRYTSPSQCVLCHQPQTTDPDTGNTVDFKVMIHKIHDGADLTAPYQIIGYGQSVNDWSTVEFPQPVNRCEACHAGAQGDRYETMPRKATCTSCHDNIVFTQAEVTTGKVLHASSQGGVEQTTEDNCIVCHAASSLEPIKRKHYTGTLDPTLPTVALTIQSITSTAPGQTPTMTFQVTVGGQPRNILTAPLTRLTATIAGPNTDFAQYWQARIQGTNSTTVPVGTLTAVDAANGIFSYAFPAAQCTDNLTSTQTRSCSIPADATGSFSVGMEGYIQAVSTDPRNAAFNPTLAFAVTDATPQPRRQIVDASNCNSCHNVLALHGGSRRNPQYCVFCHNTTLVNATVARFESSSSLEDSLSFRSMIHKIHQGENLTQPFTIGGTAPSTTNPAGILTSFADTRYPRSTSQCQACHTSKNWTLPLANSPAYAPDTSIEMSCSEDPAADGDSYCTNPFWTASSVIKTPITSSVCTSCHDAPFTAAHAQLNTTPQGVEACATCHGPGMDWDVTKFHGLP